VDLSKNFKGTKPPAQEVYFYHMLDEFGMEAN
jgi:hypothetical protein